MRLRALIFLLSASAVGCGGASNTPTCASACTGCCDANGQCKLGTSSDSCGLGGRACGQCAADEFCSVGSCLANLVTPGVGGGGVGGGFGGGSAGGRSAGGSATGGGGARVDAGVVRINPCAGRTIQCDSECIDPLVDEANCGACGVQCAAGLVCNGGQCRALPQDCVVERCPDDFGCNPETRTCSRQCFSNADCRIAGAECTSGGCRCSNFGVPQCGVCAPQSLAASCRCPQGFTSDSVRGCVDVDECAQVAQLCGPPASARCVNELGDYRCECQSGFVKVAGQCVRDLCTGQGNGGCAPTAQCSMRSATEVSCRCQSGSTGDGFTCKANCDSFDPCPSGFGCYPDPASPTGSTCSRAGFIAEGELCGEHSDCVAGTICEQSGTVGFCARPCSSSSQCAFDSTCVGRGAAWVCLKRSGTTGCDVLKQNCEGGCYPLASDDGGVVTECANAGSMTVGFCPYANSCSRGYACVQNQAMPPDYECAQWCDPANPSCGRGTCQSFPWIPGAGLCQ